MVRCREKTKSGLSIKNTTQYSVNLPEFCGLGYYNTALNKDNENPVKCIECSPGY